MSSPAARAEHLALIGRFDEAERVARQALAAEPEDPTLLTALAFTLYQADRFAEGLAAAEAACVADPGAERAHRLRGRLASSLRRHDEAVAACRMSVSLAPLAARPAIDLGTVLWVARRLPEALETAQRAVNLAPDSADAHTLVADVLDDLGHREQARAAYREALQLEPEHATARFNLATLDMRENRLRSALRGYLNVASIDPLMRDAYDVTGSADPKLTLVLDNIIVLAWNVLAWIQIWLLVTTVLIFRMSIDRPGWVVRVTAAGVLASGVALGWWLTRDPPRRIGPVVRAALRADPVLALAYLGVGACLLVYLLIAVTGRGGLVAVVAITVVALLAATQAKGHARRRRARRNR